MEGQRLRSAVWGGRHVSCRERYSLQGEHMSTDLVEWRSKMLWGGQTLKT